MFVCALRPGGEPISRAEMVQYIGPLKAHGSSVEALIDGPFVAFASSRPGHRRLRLARWRHVSGAGDVRLDNRAEVARIAGVSSEAVTSDLELVLAALDASGEASVPRLLGDFAFVAWDARAQKLLAVRDAFGVKPLHHRSARELLLFSSHTAPLCPDETYDLEFIEDYLLGSPTPGTRTIWRDVTAVPAGGIVRQRGTVRSIEKYWSASDFMPADDGDEKTNCTRFRELLEDAVRSRMRGSGDVWAQLSGGLDSSSVVALTDIVRGTGARLGGTITVVDSLGDGDERAYSDAVIRRYQLRNEQLLDYWAWQDDGEPPPMTDQPSPMYPFYARDRKLWSTVYGAGGRVLLSGMGADHYLSGPLDYITDMMAARHWRTAAREVTAWAVATRQSFWTLGRQYMLESFLPLALQSDRRRVSAPPAWLTTTSASNGLTARTGQCAPSSPRFAARVAAGLDALPAWLERTHCYGGDIELRYPFLSRPLVEWSLCLPVHHRVRPNLSKWILREAMRDVLPEEVRTRSTKGGIDARILWSLQRERKRVDDMLRDPILAQLGCIDVATLRTAVDNARRGVPVHNVHLFSALSLETWLAVRAGRWSVVPQHASSAA